MLNNRTDFSAPAAQAKQYGAPYAFASLGFQTTPSTSAPVWEEFLTSATRNEIALIDAGVSLFPTMWDVKYGPGLQNDIFELDMAAGEIVVKRTFGGFIEASAEFVPRGDNMQMHFAVSALRSRGDYGIRGALGPVHLHDAPTQSYHYEGSASQFAIVSQGSRITAKLHRISDPMTVVPEGRFIGGGDIGIRAVAFILL